MMTDQEAAAWTRGHAVGERELKAAEKEWQVERSMLIAQRNALVAEANRARAEIERLLRREPYCWGLALAPTVVWTVAILMGVV